MKRILYRSGYKYQLAETYICTVDLRPSGDIDHDFIRISRSGILLIRKGYAWDGPSGPTFDTKDFMRGSLIHDALYQLIREKHLPDDIRESADAELRKACIEDGMSQLRAWWVYKAVRLFGATALASVEIEPTSAP